VVLIVLVVVVAAAASAVIKVETYGCGSEYCSKGVKYVFQTYAFEISYARGRQNMPRPRPCKLTFDLLTLKAVSESRVTWATSVPILVFLSLSVLDLGPMYATDTSDVRRASSLKDPTL